MRAPHDGQRGEARSGVSADRAYATGVRKRPTTYPTAAHATASSANGTAYVRRRARRGGDTQGVLRGNHVCRLVLAWELGEERDRGPGRLRLGLLHLDGQGAEPGGHLL